MIKFFNNFIDTDIGYSFKKSKIAIISTIVFLIIVFSSMFASIVAPYDPFDPASISLMDAFTPPIWVDGGNISFLLGTDQQGRDMFSTMIYGSRISLTVGFASIIFAMILGISLGVTSGYFGGRYEIVVMRFTDVQLTIPSILMALLVDGIARGFISKSLHDDMAIYVLILAIGISEWPQFARVTRAATLVEKK
jgi:peptide/nickel transport system permease protein